MSFTKKDLKQIKARGMEPGQVTLQLERFKRGFSYLPLDRPATAGDGIRRLEEEEIRELGQLYEEKQKLLDIQKFVPASGAATRMFKDAFDVFQQGIGSLDQVKESHPDTHELIDRLEDFPFHEYFMETLRMKGLDPEQLVRERNVNRLLKYLLTEEGINLGNLPKGLIRFHRYDRETRTPFEEHLVEGALHASHHQGMVQIHFTLSPEHRSGFEDISARATGMYASRHKVNYRISFSEQKPSTDTIAATMDNEPFRNEDGSILFRPGGHGALLENLQDLKADLIFIKNIDNVAPDRIKDITVRYKKALAGYMLQSWDEIQQWKSKLDSDPGAETIKSAMNYMQDSLCFTIPPNIRRGKKEALVLYLRKKLDRPLRVCGMVPNQGDPGGGPFWAKNQDGSVSLQIAESNQIDPEDRDQQDIAKGATHFNPVDIVCTFTRPGGGHYSLIEYRDPDTGFISRKSKDGRDLKALELPGLWNGSMSDWNTLFVEVPLETFNPVKKINDLLRENHR